MAQQGDGRGNDTRQPARQAPRPAARQPQQQQKQTFNQHDDPFRSFPDDGVGQAGGAPEQRQPAPGARPQQPSFSAYRPEAYANQERPAPRQAPTAPEPFRPAGGGGGSRQQHHDPYHNAASDPYDSGHNDASWQSFGDYPETQRTQYSEQSFYQQHEEPASSHDAQSMHNQFFPAEPEEPQPPQRAPAPQRAAPPRAPAPQRAAAPAPAPEPARYTHSNDDDFDTDDGFAPEPAPLPVVARAAPKPAPARPSREPEPRHDGFDDDEGDFGNWDNNNFGQQPPAPPAVRPFAPHNNAKFAADDDLDADYLHDEDEFEGEEDYAEPKKGGKKLMAAVLVGAIVTGGGLAYLYKSSTGGAGGGEPALVSADARPVKETPADPGGREFPNGSKLIYERLGDNGAPASDGGTRVAAREEGNSGNDVPGVVTTGSNGTLEERIQSALQNAKRQDEPASEQTASASGSGNIDSPRPVRTEIFRPDGSVDAARPQRRQAAAAPAADDSPSAAAPSARQVAAASPAAIGGSDPGMFVQIAARNDEAAAMAAFADLKQKYSGVLGSYAPSVRKVDLGEKGVWYRLLVGPMPSKADADKMCEDLKTAGMKGCFSRKE